MVTLNGSFPRMHCISLSLSNKFRSGLVSLPVAFLQSNTPFRLTRITGRWVERQPSNCHHQLKDIKRSTCKLWFITDNKRWRLNSEAYAFSPPRRTISSNVPGNVTPHASRPLFRVNKAHNCCFSFILKETNFSQLQGNLNEWHHHLEHSNLLMLGQGWIQIQFQAAWCLLNNTITTQSMAWHGMVVRIVLEI